MYAFSSKYAFFKDSIIGSQVDPNCRFICYNIFFINKGIRERFLFVCSRNNTINCFPCFFNVIFEFVKT